MSTKSKADIRGVFSNMLTDFVTSNEDLSKALRNQAPYEHVAVTRNGWDGNTLDPEGMRKPFDRAEHTEDVVNAIKDADNAGTVSDFMVSQIQGDALASRERAYRLLHASPVRLKMHAAVRAAGHAHDGGVFKRGLQDYLASILRLGKKADSSS